MQIETQEYFDTIGMEVWEYVNAHQALYGCATHLELFALFTHALQEVAYQVQRTLVIFGNAQVSVDTILDAMQPTTAKDQKVP